MDESPAKRAKVISDRSLQDKVQCLPLLCVDAICKFTPTSKLFRLYSTAVPLPGANWNFGLEAVLKKRRPFSLSVDLAYNRGDVTRRIDALLDSSGAKVATINYPEEFQFSPLCEFVQSAALPFRIIPEFLAVDPRLRHVIPGQPLLPHLPNVSKLTLVELGNFKPYPKAKNDKDCLLPALKVLLPQLESFTLERSHKERKILDLKLAEMLPEMVALKHLDVPRLVLDTLLRAAIAASAKSEAIRQTLSGLSSIRLRQTYRDGASDMSLQCLSFISACCTQLTQLSVTVAGEFKPYLVALQALVSLTTLGLELMIGVKTTGITFDENEVVHSVTELRLCDYWYPSVESDATKIAIASLFPKVTVAALRWFDFAAKVCEKQAWPELAKLTCFNGFSYYAHGFSTTVSQFVAYPNLPSTVDLSPIVDRNLARDSSMLAAIYQAMHGGPIKTLLLRGPVHREALSRLQTHIDFHGESAKITAWKDRDLGEQTSIMHYGTAIDVPATEFTENTDLRITGRKQNGDVFMIRIVHQHTKKTDFFD